MTEVEALERALAKGYSHIQNLVGFCLGSLHGFINQAIQREKEKGRSNLKFFFRGDKNKGEITSDPDVFLL